MERGYNTNYNASWFLCRGGPRVRYDSSVATPKIATWSPGVSPIGLKGIEGMHGTTGPLTQHMLSTSIIVTSNIPLLGDASPGNVDTAVAAANFEYLGTDRFANGIKKDRIFLQQGELLCQAMNDGPAYYQSSSKLIKKIAANNALLDVQLDCDKKGGFCGAPTGATNDLYLQDTRGWFATHGGGRSPSVNFLMADGSIKEIADTNNDRFLNPGVGIPATLTTDQYDTLGYRDKTTELHYGEFFSGVFISQTAFKGKFEE